MYVRLVYISIGDACTPGAGLEKIKGDPPVSGARDVDVACTSTYLGRPIVGRDAYSGNMSFVWLYLGFGGRDAKWLESREDARWLFHDRLDVTTCWYLGYSYLLLYN